VGGRPTAEGTESENTGQWGTNYDFWWPTGQTEKAVCEDESKDLITRNRLAGKRRSSVAQDIGPVLNVASRSCLQNRGN
jgi:hypothetical protein